jgi:hypothetical protein
LGGLRLLRRWQRGIRAVDVEQRRRHFHCDWRSHERRKGRLDVRRDELGYDGLWWHDVPSNEYRRHGRHDRRDDGDLHHRRRFDEHDEHVDVEHWNATERRRGLWHE